MSRHLVLWLVGLGAGFVAVPALLGLAELLAR